MTASEDWQAELLRIMDEHDAADRAARRKSEATYRRAAPTPEADQGRRQSAETGRDLHELLNEG